MENGFASPDASSFVERVNIRYREKYIMNEALVVSRRNDRKTRQVRRNCQEKKDRETEQEETVQRVKTHPCQTKSP